MNLKTNITNYYGTRVLGYCGTMVRILWYYGKDTMVVGYYGTMVLGYYMVIYGTIWYYMAGADLRGMT